MAAYSRPISASLGAGKTGLSGGTLGYRVFDPVAALTRIARTTAGITEHSGAQGNYYATAAWDTTWGDCIVFWDDHATTPTFQAMGDERQEDEATAAQNITVEGTTIRVED